MNLKLATKLISAFVLVMVLYVCWWRYLSPDFNDKMLTHHNYFLELVAIYYGWIVFVYNRIILPSYVSMSLGKDRQSFILISSYLLVLVPRILIYVGAYELAKIVFFVPSGWVIGSVLKGKPDREPKRTISSNLQASLKSSADYLMIVIIPIIAEYVVLLYNAHVRNVNVMNLGYYLAFFIGFGSLLVAFAYRSMFSSIVLRPSAGRLSIEVKSEFQIRKSVVLRDLAIIAVLGPLIVGTAYPFGLLRFGKSLIFLFLPFMNLGSLLEIVLLVVLSLGGVLVSVGFTKRWFASVPKRTILQMKKNLEQYPRGKPTLVEDVLNEVTFALVRTELFFIVPWLLLSPDSPYRLPWIMILGMIILKIYEISCKKLTRSFAVYGLVVISSLGSILLSAVLEISHIYYRRRLIMTYK